MRQQTLSQAVSNVSSPCPRNRLPLPPLGGPLVTQPTVHLKSEVVAGGTGGGCDECVNGQSFVHSSGYHSNISAEMEFEFQKV